MNMYTVIPSFNDGSVYIKLLSWCAVDYLILQYIQPYLASIFPVQQQH